MKKQKPAWTPIRKRLTSLDEAELVALVKDLYDFSPGNRDFLAARFLTDGAENGSAPLDSYRRRIEAAFNIDKPQLKLAEGRRAIREYRKATGNLAGTVELMLTYVEAGTRFTCEFGDIDERFYSSLTSVLNELSSLLFGAARECYPAVAPRFASLREMAENIGWGYGDTVCDVESELSTELGSGSVPKSGREC